MTSQPAEPAEQGGNGGPWPSAEPDAGDWSGNGEPHEPNGPVGPTGPLAQPAPEPGQLDGQAGQPEPGDAAPTPPASTCTPSQLRRFIKSRAYIPMHELRRRFLINGTDDEVHLVALDGRSIFVGLPPREGRILGDLLRAGEVGYELSLDPTTPIVIGVYPMRPVPRS